MREQNLIIKKEKIACVITSMSKTIAFHGTVKIQGKNMGFCEIIFWL